MIAEAWQQARKILLIRLDNLGDVLLSTPAFHAVKTALPAASLTLLTSPVGTQIGRLNPDLDAVITYQAPWVDPWQKLPQDSRRELEMIERIRAEHFDGAIIFTSFRQSSLPAAYLCYLADIPLRLAASIDGPGSLLTTRHKHPERLMHEVERGLDLVGAIGIPPGATNLVLQVPDEAHRQVAAYLQQHGLAEQHPLIVLHPGCTMPARTYPWTMYAGVIEELVARCGAFVVITGAQDERELVEQIQLSLNSAVRSSTLTMAGDLSFAAFCGLIQQSDLIVTNNTGPAHIAAALQTPIVELFALTNPPEQWRPWQVAQRLLYHDVPCRICYSRVCPYEHQCLRLVTPEMVALAASELLAQASEQECISRAILKGGVS